MRFTQHPAPPRLRDWKCGQVYHIYQRSSQREHAFDQPKHLIPYLDRLDLLARRYQVRVHTFCVMSNQVHFMLEPLRRGAISRLMQHLQSFHARFVNALRGTQGHLWRNHFHSKHIESPAEYRETFLFIEKQPVEGRLGKKAHRYVFSSAAAHAANQTLYLIKHRKEGVQVKLYLERWREEFEIPVIGPTGWPAWLATPRLPEFLKKILATIGKPPGEIEVIGDLEFPMATARAG